MSAFNIKEPPLICLQIGERGHGDEETLAAAQTFVASIHRWPRAERWLMVEGYDDDPREVWQIPEAKRSYQLFARAVIRLTHLPMKEWGLDAVSFGIVAMCLDMAKATKDEDDKGWTIVPHGVLP